MTQGFAIRVDRLKAELIQQTRRVHALLEACFESVFARDPAKAARAMAMDDESLSRRILIKRLRGHTWEVNAVAYSPDGSQLASGCQDGTIRFWDPHPPTIRKIKPALPPS